MVARVNRQILLKSRPEGAPSLDNFALKQGSVPEPGDGEVLMRTHWLSLDPYMRGRMSAAKSYARPVEVGATMVGGTVGEVVASRNPNFAVGDIAVGYGVGGGRVKYREDVVEGLGNAPGAFLGLLHGKNFGKLLVKVA